MLDFAGHSFSMLADFGGHSISMLGFGGHGFGLVGLKTMYQSQQQHSSQYKQPPDPTILQLAIRLQPLNQSHFMHTSSDQNRHCYPCSRQGGIAFTRLPQPINSIWQG